MRVFVAHVISAGRQFHVLAAAEGKARPPKVIRREKGIIKREDVEDRRRERDGTLELDCI